MTLLDILKKAGLAVDPLRKVVGKVGELAPDLAAESDMILAQLDAPVALENLVALAAALPGEIKNIAQGKIDPRDHPSDAA